MNKKTARLIRKYARETDVPYRPLKRIWRNTPKNKKYSLRKKLTIE